MFIISEKLLLKCTDAKYIANFSLFFPSTKKRKRKRNLIIIKKKHKRKASVPKNIHECIQFMSAIEIHIQSNGSQLSVYAFFLVSFSICAICVCVMRRHGNDWLIKWDWEDDEYQYIQNHVYKCYLVSGQSIDTRHETRLLDNPQCINTDIQRISSSP